LKAKSYNKIIEGSSHFFGNADFLVNLYLMMTPTGTTKKLHPINVNMFDLNITTAIPALARS
jgi:hypothetical protein